MEILYYLEVLHQIDVAEYEESRKPPEERNQQRLDDLVALLGQLSRVYHLSCGVFFYY